MQTGTSRLQICDSPVMPGIMDIDVTAEHPSDSGELHMLNSYVRISTIKETMT